MCATSAWIAAAMSSASFWESVEYWSLGAVTLGVAGEYCAEFTRLKNSEHWKHRVEKWSTLLVIMALAVELLATARTNTINNLTIADLGNKAQQAAALAGQLGAKVDELPSFVAQKKKEMNALIYDFNNSSSEQKKQIDMVIAELNSDREKLEKSRTEALVAAAATKKDLADMQAALNRERDLQRRMIAAMTPREFSKAQESAFIEHASPFHGLIVDVWYFPTTTPDAAKFSASIVRLLTDAHWVARGPATFMSGYATNISIFKRADASPSARDAAAMLIREFNADGLSAGPQPDFSPDDERFKYGFNVSTDPRHPDIIVVVGNKE